MKTFFKICTFVLGALAIIALITCFVFAYMAVFTGVSMYFDAMCVTMFVTLVFGAGLGFSAIKLYS